MFGLVKYINNNKFNFLNYLNVLFDVLTENMDPSVFGISARSHVLQYLYDLCTKKFIDNVFGILSHKTGCLELKITRECHLLIQKFQNELYEKSLYKDSLFRFFLYFIHLCSCTTILLYRMHFKTLSNSIIFYLILFNNELCL